MKSTANYQQHESPKLVKIRIILIHLLSLGVIFVPFNWNIFFFFLFMYSLRVFAWEGGSHRYFAHRSYKTSRFFQLFLAILAASGGQRGPIWWATKHRKHHKYSDKIQDPHSPMQLGRFGAYYGWLLKDDASRTNLDEAKDFSKYPELRFVNKYHAFFPYIGFLLIYLLGEYTNLMGGEMGVSALFWGGILSLVLSMNAAFILNIATHKVKPSFFNLRKFETKDTSTNVWWLSIVSLGGSWHHNHHFYPLSASSGFYWWEIDIVYYILKILSFFHIVWDLNKVPKKVYQSAFPIHNSKTITTKQEDMTCL